MLFSQTKPFKYALRIYCNAVFSYRNKSLRFQVRQKSLQSCFYVKLVKSPLKTLPKPYATPEELKEYSRKMAELDLQAINNVGLKEKNNVINAPKTFMNQPVDINKSIAANREHMFIVRKVTSDFFFLRMVREYFSSTKYRKYEQNTQLSMNFGATAVSFSPTKYLRFEQNHEKLYTFTVSWESCFTYEDRSLPLKYKEIQLQVFRPQSF